MNGYVRAAGLLALVFVIAVIFWLGLIEAMRLLIELGRGIVEG